MARLSRQALLFASSPTARTMVFALVILNSWVASVAASQAIGSPARQLVGGPSVTTSTKLSLSGSKVGMKKSRTWARALATGRKAVDCKQVASAVVQLSCLLMPKALSAEG